MTDGQRDKKGNKKKNWIFPRSQGSSVRRALIHKYSCSEYFDAYEYPTQDFRFRHIEEKENSYFSFFLSTFFLTKLEINKIPSFWCSLEVLILNHSWQSTKILRSGIFWSPKCQIFSPTKVDLISKFPLTEVKFPYGK